VFHLEQETRTKEQAMSTGQRGCNASWLERLLFIPLPPASLNSVEGLETGDHQKMEAFLH
jgi:hypothetical protein